MLVTDALERPALSQCPLYPHPALPAPIHRSPVNTANAIPVIPCSDPHPHNGKETRTASLCPCLPPGIPADPLFLAAAAVAPTTGAAVSITVSAGLVGSPQRTDSQGHNDGQHCQNDHISPNTRHRHVLLFVTSQPQPRRSGYESHALPDSPCGTAGTGYQPKRRQPPRSTG